VFSKPEKKFAQIRFVAFEKNEKTTHFYSENDVTKPKAKATLLSLPVKLLAC